MEILRVKGLGRGQVVVCLFHTRLSTGSRGNICHVEFGVLLWGEYVILKDMLCQRTWTAKPPN